MFRESLHETYDILFDIDADVLNTPDDYYTTISETVRRNLAFSN